MKKHGYYSIGEIAKICKIPSSTLRYYDEIGVLKPSYIDSETGYRYYDREALLYVPVLRYYQGWGLKLKDIVALLELDDLTGLKKSYDGKIEEHREQIARLAQEIDSMVSWRELITETEAVIGEGDFSVSLKNIPVTKMFKIQPTAFPGMRFENILINNEFCSKVYSYNYVTLGALWVQYPSQESRLREDFNNVTLLIKNHPFYDNSPDVQVMESFTAVACYHQGPHNQVTATYDKINQWAKLHNFTLRGDVIERYVIDLWSTKNSNWFLTEIFCPLAENKS